MARNTIVKNFLVLVNVIFVVMASCLIGACTNHGDELMGEPTKSKTDTVIVQSPVYFDFINGDTVLLNEEGSLLPNLRAERVVAKLKVTPEEVTVDKDQPWALQEDSKKVPTQEYLGGRVDFQYNHGKEELADSFYVWYKGRKLPFWRPKDLRVTEREIAFEETSKSTSKTVEFNLTVEGLDKVFAKAQALLNTEIGYVPSFQKMIWKSWHFGPAVAEYANGEAIVQCPDSLHADELWDNGEYKNPLRKLTHSKNTFSVAVSGTEVDDINAVVGKSLTVNGDKASVAEFSVTVTRTSKDIVEKNLPYTYNGKTINFIDSLHACGYKLNGGQVISKSQVRIDLVREGSTETVSFNLPVNITEKVTLKEILRNYIHKAFRKVASVSGSIITVICDNNGEMTKVFSNNTKEKSDIPYTWTFKFTYNVPSGLTTDVIGHTYNFNNGSTSVEGKDVTVSFSSSSISDIMFEGKNYKSEAPQCSVEVKAITFNSKTQATVTFNGEGENVTAQVPVNLTEKPADVDVDIMRISVTDAYQNQHAAQEGTYLHIFGKDKNGSYVVLSQRVGESAFQSTTISNADGNAINDCGRAIAYVYNGSSYQIGTVTSEDGKADKGYYLRYYVADGRLAYSLGSGTATEALKDGFRDAIRGTVSKANADGTWTVSADGKTYTFKGL